MAGLYKKEILIRPVSTITVPGAITFVHNWLDDNFQNVASNKNSSGDFIDYYFADIFDSRTGNLIRVYTNAAGAYYSMSIVDFDIIDKSTLATAQEFDAVQVDLDDIIAINVDQTDRIVVLEDCCANGGGGTGTGGTGGTGGTPVTPITNQSEIGGGTF